MEQKRPRRRVPARTAQRMLLPPVEPGPSFLDALSVIVNDLRRNRPAELPASLVRAFRLANPDFPTSFKPLPPFIDTGERRLELLNRSQALIETLHNRSFDAKDGDPALSELGRMLLDIRDLDSIIAHERRQIPAIKNRTQVIAYSTAIISALEEALEFDPKRHHNQPPPALRIEDDKYLSDIQELVVELRRLNVLLSAKKPRSAQTRRATISLSANTQKFLDNYIPLLGKGTAALTVATMAGLLYHLGVGDQVVGEILKAIRFIR